MRLQTVRHRSSSHMPMSSRRLSDRSMPRNRFTSVSECPLGAAKFALSNEFCARTAGEGHPPNLFAPIRKPSYALPMRLRSDIYVSALVRRVFGMGGFAAVEHKGAEEAGAIFIRQRFRDGLENLYAPAPQNFFSGEDDGSRKFETRLERAEPDAMRDALDRELRFDPDLWLVELEIDELGDLFPVVKPDP